LKGKLLPGSYEIQKFISMLSRFRHW